MRELVTWVLLSMLLGGCELLPKKEHGTACERAAECGEGLACVGESVKRCMPCAGARECTEEGRCGVVDGTCVARGPLDCQRSTRCREHGECRASEGSCVAERRAKEEEGCPCGCDASEAMVTALREEGATGAATIQASLDTIAEREGVGYVTEAMVVHRLRLLALADELGEAVRLRKEPSARARAARAARTAKPPRVAGSLAVHSELVTHGETTALIDGRDKTLRACFHLWLQIENRGEATVLARPTLRGTVPFDVTRWYVEDGDGTPWDGALAAHETRAVRVIGYLGEPVVPGTAVDAIVELGALVLPAATYARGRWDHDEAR